MNQNSEIKVKAGTRTFFTCGPNPAEQTGRWSWVKIFSFVRLEEMRFFKKTKNQQTVFRKLDTSQWRPSKISIMSIRMFSLQNRRCVVMPLFSLCVLLIFVSLCVLMCTYSNAFMLSQRFSQPIHMAPVCVCNQCCVDLLLCLFCCFCMSVYVTVLNIFYILYYS